MVLQPCVDVLVTSAASLRTVSMVLALQGVSPVLGNGCGI